MAIYIGPPASDTRYLDTERVCEAVNMAGSEGVHPRFEFLSNMFFLERVTGMMMNNMPHGGSSGIQDDDKKQNTAEQKTKDGIYRNIPDNEKETTQDTLNKVTEECPDGTTSADME